MGVISSVIEEVKTIVLVGSFSNHLTKDKKTYVYMSPHNHRDQF
jgi:hypothetical protein